MFWSIFFFSILSLISILTWHPLTEFRVYFHSRILLMWMRSCRNCHLEPSSRRCLYRFKLMKLSEKLSEVKKTRIHFSMIRPFDKRLSVNKKLQTIHIFGCIDFKLILASGRATFNASRRWIFWRCRNWLGQNRRRQTVKSSTQATITTGKRTIFACILTLDCSFVIFIIQLVNSDDLEWWIHC